MRGSFLAAAVLALGASSVSLPGHAAEIILPTPFVVPGFQFPVLQPDGTYVQPPPGISFVYSGTLTGDDTLNLTASGSVAASYMHTSFANAAGVVDFGYLGFGNGQATGTDSNGNNMDALLLDISGVGEEQLLKPTVANGLGSSAPPTDVTLPSTSLSSLGFGLFSVTDPTLTFLANVPDERLALGSFTITQTAAPSAVPEPGSVWLLFALASVSIALASKKMPSRP